MKQYLLSVHSYDVNGDINPMPDPDTIQQMFDDVDKFNAELEEKGAWVFGGGLEGPQSATVVREQDGQIVTTDGPFPEAKELIAGFWLWQVNSKDEAIEWLKRSPFQEAELEIRQVFEAEDFGAEFTPELREQEERLRAQVATRQ